jgi:hypothetical protein
MNSGNLDGSVKMGRMKELLYVTSGEAQFDEADKGEPPVKANGVGEAPSERSISQPPAPATERRRSQSA